MAVLPLHDSILTHPVLLEFEVHIPTPLEKLAPNIVYPVFVQSTDVRDLSLPLGVLKLKVCVTTSVVRYEYTCYER